MTAGGYSERASRRGITDIERAAAAGSDGVLVGVVEHQRAHGAVAVERDGPRSGDLAEERRASAYTIRHNLRIPVGRHAPASIGIDIPLWRAAGSDVKLDAGVAGVVEQRGGISAQRGR